MEAEFRITFSDLSAAERSRLVTRLNDSLSELKGAHTSILREREDSQDPGTILSIVLGGPAVVLAVKSIAAWLVRNNQSGVSIQTPDGTVVIKNMKSEDVPEVIVALKNIIGS